MMMEAPKKTESEQRDGCLDSLFLFASYFIPMVTARVSTALRAHGISPGTAGLAVTLLGLSVVGLVAPVGPYIGCSPGR